MRILLRRKLFSLKIKKKRIFKSQLQIVFDCYCIKRMKTDIVSMKTTRNKNDINIDTNEPKSIQIQICQRSSVYSKVSAFGQSLCCTPNCAWKTIVKIQTRKFTQTHKYIYYVR